MNSKSGLDGLLSVEDILKIRFDKHGEVQTEPSRSSADVVDSFGPDFIVGETQSKVPNYFRRPRCASELFFILYILYTQFALVSKPQKLRFTDQKWSVRTELKISYRQSRGGVVRW